VPFRADGWLLPRKQALVIQRACLQQVSRVLPSFVTRFADFAHKRIAQPYAIFFTLRGLILQLGP